MYIEYMCACIHVCVYMYAWVVRCDVIRNRGTLASFRYRHVCFIVHLCVRVCIYICVCVYTYVCMCMYICMCVCTCA